MIWLVNLQCSRWKLLIRLKLIVQISSINNVSTTTISITLLYGQKHLKSEVLKYTTCLPTKFSSCGFIKIFQFLIRIFRTYQIFHMFKRVDRVYNPISISILASFRSGVFLYKINSTVIRYAKILSVEPLKIYHIVNEAGSNTNRNISA